MFESRVPSIEEIYNTYHKETFFAMKGGYPRSVKNFSKVLTEERVELLNRFQNMLKRNYGTIDWKIYIKACAAYYKRNFDLKILGSLKGNKIYKDYVFYKENEDSEQNIVNEIMRSIKFIKDFCVENNKTLKDYFLEQSPTFPTFFKHMYAGSVSQYFYAAMTMEKLQTLFKGILDDVFFEFFKCSKSTFLDDMISPKQRRMVKSAKIFKLIDSLNKKIDFL